MTTPAPGPYVLSDTCLRLHVARSRRVRMLFITPGEGTQHRAAKA